MSKYPEKKNAQGLAAYGRYGDTMLVHMNEHEVRGLASMSPTGELTTNPVTGQPEAFLPFLAPLIGSWLGSAGLTGLGAGGLGGLIGAGGISSGLAGAIGSGLATTAVTGDIKKGLTAGLTGFGMGKVLGGATDMASGVTDAASAVDTATSAITDTGVSPDLLGKMAENEMLGGLATDMPNMSADQWGQFGKLDELDRLKEGLAHAQTRSANMSFGERSRAYRDHPGELMKGLSKKEAMLPMALGLGQYAQLDYQDMMDERARKSKDKKGREYARGVADLNRNMYRYAQGGPVKGYMDGGDFEGMHEYAEYLGMSSGLGAQSSAQQEGVQTGLRGEKVLPPAGYRPGFGPEYNFFSETQDYAPSVYTPEAPGLPPAGGDDPFAAHKTAIGGYFDRQGIDTDTNIRDTYQYLQDNELDVYDVGDRYNLSKEQIDAHLKRLKLGEWADLDGDGEVDPGEVGGDGGAGGGDADGPVDISGDNIVYDEAGVANTLPYFETFTPSKLADYAGDDDWYQPETNAQKVIEDTYRNYFDQAGGDRNAFLTKALDFGSRYNASAMDVYNQLQEYYPNANRTYENTIAKLSGTGWGVNDAGNIYKMAEGGIIQGAKDKFGEIVDSRKQMLATEAQNSRPVGFPDQPPVPQSALGMEEATAFNDRLVDAASKYPEEHQENIYLSLLNFARQGSAEQGRALNERQIGNMAEMLHKNETKFKDDPLTPEEIIGSTINVPGMAAGGPVPPQGIAGAMPAQPAQPGQEQQLIQATVAAISGQIPEPGPIIEAFISAFGQEAFEALRQQVLSQQGAQQTEGLTQGAGGGMDDMIPGMTSDGQEIAVSPGEYIVPADVVSGLGDGSTESGASVLDEMAGRVRQMKTGGMVQPGKIDHGSVMPA